MKRTGRNSISRGISFSVRVVAVGSLSLGLFASGSLAAPSMVNYTNYPTFLNKSGPTNILFLVDMANAALEAAYSGSNHLYPISFKTATATESKYAANVTLDDASGPDLVAVDSNGAVISGANETAPADAFDSSRKYFGFFDPYRCYTYSGTEFVHAARKVNSATPPAPDYTVACTSTQWDGNFLNWLAMRKQEMIYQALIGGHPLPAASNGDGTSDNLSGAKNIGENGAPSFDCSTNSKSCWRYVKFVPAAALVGRVPTAVVSSDVTLASGTITAATGKFFGLGEGTGQGAIYVNDNTTANPFDNATANRYQLQVSLTTEPNDTPGTGAMNNCRLGDPDFMGTRLCYQRERSWGLFQRMRVDDGLRVSIMFVNSSTGKGGSLQIPFDTSLVAADYTNIRNEHEEANSPLAESLYEALCYYRKSAGPCYDNGGGVWKTGYSSTTAVVGDPYYVKAVSAIVPCCKNFVLMISPGQGVKDGSAPDVTSPFGNLFTGTNLGVDFTQAPESMTAVAASEAGDRLDDVAFYGRTQDVRATIAGEQNVTFFAVNAMGGKRGAKILASAAKYGGFEDLDKNDTSMWAPTAADYASDVDSSSNHLNNVNICVYPSGSNLQPSTAGPYYSHKEWDVNKDCIPDTYFDASNGEGIEDQVLKAISDILKRAASGTSLSVLSSSTTGDGAVYQAYFFPEEFDISSGSLTQVRWTGYLQGLWVDSYGNLREDTNNDGNLIYADDNIIETCVDSLFQAKFIRYPDSNGDGRKNDAATALTCDANGVDLREMKGIWEGGKKLAMRNLTTKPRKIFTWVDLDNDGEVDASEQKDFVVGTGGLSDAEWRPYLQGTATGTFTATNIISYVHGTAVADMRNRTKPIAGESGTHVWRLGDIVNSTPTLVGPPQERFDVLYGDPGYRKYAQRWRNRRLTVYAGANDGMLHAFNGGYAHRGDNPAASSTAVEHGYYTTGPTANDSTKPDLGEELWAFIPYYLLPQLRWMAQEDYTHVSYVDLKAKATDVRIFPTSETGCTSVPVADTCIHPDGWGTILIVGLRFGGSCGNCLAVSATNNGGPPLTYNADFNNDGDVTDLDDTRTFYSGYIVLDVTDPDNPKVLNAFTSPSMGLTTGYPTVVRVSDKDDLKNDHSHATFYLVVGSGPHGYDGSAKAGAKMFAAELVLPGASSRVLSTLPVLDDRSGSTGTAEASFMAHPITYDRDLDFRSDAVYVGRSIAPTGAHTAWWGKFYRLTMGICDTNPCMPDTSSGTWGVPGKVTGTRVPTDIVTAVPVGGSPVDLGPITGSSTVTLDDASNSWLFFGTGRYFGAADKVSTDRQYIVGVKDEVVKGGCTQSDVSDCKQEDLVNVSGVTVTGTTVTGGTSSTFSGLLTDISGKHGWVIRLEPADATLGLGAERFIVNPTLIGGALFMPTFMPYTDACTASGQSFLYATYYKSGTGYPDPILMDSSGAGQRRVSVGEGVASSVSIQIGAEPTGMTGYIQSSNSLLKQLSPNAPSTVWSQLLSWVSERS